MTLHWWMHWFWVTAHLTVILANPLPSTTEEPRIRETYGESTIGSKIKLAETTIEPQIIGRVTERHEERQRLPEVSTRASFRVAKAISSYDTPIKSNSASANRPGDIKESPDASVSPFLREITSEEERVGNVSPNSSINDRNRNVNVARTRTSSSNMITRQGQQDASNGTGGMTPASSKGDSRITWVLTTTNEPPVGKETDEPVTGVIPIRNYSSSSSNVDRRHEEEKSDLTVLPLRLETTRFKLVVNRTTTITANGANGFSTRTLNGSEDIEIDEELAEPRLSPTAASILQAGISESTRLSRARNTFSSDFRRDREEDRSSDIEADNDLFEDDGINVNIESSTPSAIDIAAITGSCLATVVLLSTMASLGFIMYRRKYLNPPQTLNSDKCSNPDSSGYIDDSTIRDNSEEMYSLDNDSFLNSLEAMTIQNYWTDSVKHTKL